VASAWATFFCYGSMMVACFVWGQKKYPVPYAWKKLLAYMVIVAVLYSIHQALNGVWHSRALNYTIATMFLLLFALFIYRIEKKEFVNILKIRKNPV